MFQTPIFRTYSVYFMLAIILYCMYQLLDHVKEDKYEFKSLESKVLALEQAQSQLFMQIRDLQHEHQMHFKIQSSKTTTID